MSKVHVLPMGPRSSLGPAAILLLISLGAGSSAWGAQSPSLQNGDSNGDGKVDLSDAVHLLQHLYLGGPPPAVIECPDCPACPDPCAPTGFRMRVINGLACDSQAITAALDMDGTAVLQATGDVPSECKDFSPSGDIVPATLTVTTAACGTLKFCADIPVASGRTYDVVLYFDSGLGLPAALWYEQGLDTDGSCPVFPTPDMAQTGDFVDCTGGGEAPGDGWSSALPGW